MFAGSQLVKNVVVGSIVVRKDERIPPIGLLLDQISRFGDADMLAGSQGGMAEDVSSIAARRI